ncbi:hypothetical protein L2E82_25968 [Cichorium intybus]|uniref:Uncharacterized protein n=1 Tax=Cichorium intybus TaxID=13427 RepID=A0ACB9E5N8_CICIN|nr:hypothetical protein L2E82_25968 [Cichorium intybus]
MLFIDDTTNDTPLQQHHHTIINGSFEFVLDFFAPDLIATISSSSPPYSPSHNSLHYEKLIIDLHLICIPIATSKILNPFCNFTTVFELEASSQQWRPNL